MSRSCLSIRFAALASLPGLLLVTACHGQAPPAPPRSNLPPASSDAQPFPREDARTALAAAARGLRSCGTEGRSEEVVAALRFEPTGRVGDVDVDASDAETTSCLRTKLAEIAVTPFDGAPVTMEVRVRL